MSNKPKIKEKDNSIGDNFAVWIAFIVMSIYLLLDIKNFNSLTLKYLLSSVCGIIGAVGLGIEINTLTNEKFKVDNIAVGLALIAIYIFISSFFDNDFFQALSLGVLLFGAYGVISGTINMLFSLVSAQNTKRTNLKNIILFIIEILGGIAAILSILQTISQLNI